MNKVIEYNPSSTDIAIAINVINYYQQVALLDDAMETFYRMKYTRDVLDFYHNIVTFNEKLEKSEV